MWIEERFWLDERVSILSDLIGDPAIAIGVMLRSYVTARKQNRKSMAIPSDVWNAEKLPNELFTCGWAERRTDGSVHIRHKTKDGKYTLRGS